MATRRIGIIFHGATGGLGRKQHLAGLLAIAAEGGLPLAGGGRLMPDIILAGRNEERLRAVAAETGLERWTTDLEAALASDQDSVLFDAASTGVRYEILGRAIAAGKHVYTEKPVAGTLEEAMALVRSAEVAGIRNGVVQDKLFTPGLSRLKEVCQSGLLGSILEVRIEMGHWVFDGMRQSAQRSSWNYRKADGGGLRLDMFPHWRYMIEGTVGPIRAITSTARTHITRRRDEAGRDYDADAEDSVFTQMEIEGGAIASVNSSWCSRVRREATITMQVDGMEGSAFATLEACYIQPDVATPRLGRSSDGPPAGSPFDHWHKLPQPPATNSYRRGWELFLRHVAEDGPFTSTLREGAKGVQLAELGKRSDRERRWLDVPELN